MPDAFPLPADGILTVSWSSLRRWEECRHKQLRYAQKRTGLVDGRIFLPGTVADRVMRAWLDSDDPKPGQMPGMVEEYLRKFSNPANPDADPDAYQKIRWRGDRVADRQKVYDFCVDVVTKLEPILMKYVVPYDYWPEYKFDVITRIPGLDGEPRPIRLIGGIDIAVQLDTTTYHLFDLKATANKDYIRKVVGQGIFYFLAWKQIKKVYPQRFGFVAPALEHQVQWANVDIEDVRHMVTRIIAYAHSAWESDMPPKEDDVGCSYCEARSTCDKFKPRIKVDADGKTRASLEMWNG